MPTRREWDLERICLSALERPAAERAAFLSDACGGDEELRREAESLIAHDGAAASFLEVPPVSGALSPSFGVAVPTMAGGDCIGPYAIVSTLGSGGMGEVYYSFPVTDGGLATSTTDSERSRSTVDRRFRLRASEPVRPLHGARRSSSLRT